MKRREFITLLGGAAAAWPLAAGAQQSGRIRRIGVLMAAAESDRQVQSRLAVFRGELQKLGWTDIIMETRYFASSDAETVSAIREGTRRAAARLTSFAKPQHYGRSTATNARYPNHFRNRF